MAEELRLIHANEQNNIDLTPVSKIEIYSFFDPFYEDCFNLSATLAKLKIEYQKYVKIRQILNPSLKVLTKCQAQSTCEFDNVALAFKAAELQGHNRASRFLNLIQNEIIPHEKIITTELIRKCAYKSGIDLSVFIKDLKEQSLTDSLQTDLHIAREMDINMTPSLVFFNEDVHSEGLKVEGLYPYHIYTYIIQELIGTEVEKQLPPKLLDYIQSQSIISAQEIATIYEWPEKIVKRELKKLQLQNYIEQQDSVHGDFWKFKKSK